MEKIKHLRKAQKQSGYTITVAIPSEICKELKIETGTPLMIHREGAKIIVEKG